MFRAAARLSLLAIIAIACTVNPQSGRRQVILMSEEHEKEIDREASEYIAAEIGVVEDTELARYVENLGEELAELSLREGVEYEFAIVEMDEPNAFALPGGHIYVSRGLLVLANSEAELANVLGHEIGHVTSRHAAQRDTQQKIATVATVLGAVAAAAAGEVDVAAGVGNYGPLMAAGLLAAYGRDQEREADAIGQDLSGLAGIDPKGMADFLEQLDDYTRLKTGASREPSFFDSHPATPERVAETITNAEVARWEPRPGLGLDAASPRDRYLDRIDGFSIGRPASEGVIVDRTLLHADLGFAVRFPLGWEVVNGHSRVMAGAPTRDAVVMLELQGPGDDPRAAAAADAQRLGLHFEKAAPLTVNGLPAFRVRAVAPGPLSSATAEITWIAHRGLIYRLTASAKGSAFERRKGSMRTFSRSFRELRPDELPLVTELRVRVVEARAGESLADLSARTGNLWDLNETAVANALLVDDALEAGQRVKIARRERYRPTAEPPPPSDSDGLPPLGGGDLRR